MAFYLPWLLFGLTLYFLVGMILTYHTPLGKKYFVNNQIRLVSLWIFPITGIIVYVIATLLVLVVDEVILFNNKNNPGLKELLGLK